MLSNKNIRKKQLFPSRILTPIGLFMFSSVCRLKQNWFGALSLLFTESTLKSSLPFTFSLFSVLTPTRSLSGLFSFHWFHFLFLSFLPVSLPSITLLSDKFFFFLPHRAFSSSSLQARTNLQWYFFYLFVFSLTDMAFNSCVYLFSICIVCWLCMA